MRICDSTVEPCLLENGIYSQYAYKGSALLLPQYQRTKCYFFLKEKLKHTYFRKTKHTRAQFDQ